ncbi:hypothetical protein HYFRA_00012407 [Hymenoscyphus fraxineus]|uniref:Uncharacterized protein n=1 Tax=Hymenoscyphus fraxineus TaxID=746836 RepID=A0A9N9L956_9HELO|nr:hypothetical protein HYFRA_00012407 [Hymenoscyphus fraxineus]
MRLTLTQLLVAAVLAVGVNACTRNAECPACTGGLMPVCEVTYRAGRSFTECICAKNE